MGSKLELLADHDSITIILRVPPSDFARVASAIFISFFLILWAGGWIAGAVALLSGHHPWFMILWLLFWSFVGVLMGRTAWLLVQPSRAESIVIANDRFRYDPGTSPIVNSYTFGYQWTEFRWMSQTNFYRELFTNRLPMEHLRMQISRFSIEEDHRGKRLVMQVGEERVEIGAGMWDPDREWLYKVLKDWHTASKVS